MSPGIDDLVAQTAARRIGSRFVSDCPACGYRNALTISQGDTQPLVTCHAGCDRGELLSVLGLLRHGPRLTLPSRSRPARASAEHSEYARKLWDESRNALGTIAHDYLRSRAIDADIPESIRFHPCAPHPNKRRYPAMIGAVTRWPASEAVALHRTYLDPAGAGKANVEPQKASLGPIRGGAVRPGGGRGR
jgi:hypothetical protein